MRRYIDEKTGKIVNILEKDEANKVVKILIDYFFLEGSVPAGRLNLVGYLKDYIKLGNVEDIKEIGEYIGEYKKTLKLAKEDEENFEALYKFFRIYKDLEDSKATIEDASNYISEMTDKKEELSKKDQKDMTKKDKILNLILDKEIDFKRLAKIACDAWENKIKEQMNSGKKEIHISLEQEIAYQDLLEFAAGVNVEVSKKHTEKKSEETPKIVESVEEKKVEEKKEDTVSKININVEMPDKKEPVRVEIETKKEEKENKDVESVDKPVEKIHTIQINHLAGEDEELVLGGSNESKVQPEPVHKAENTQVNHHKITQHDINELLGLDDDLANNSNSFNVKKVETVDKPEPKVHTIQINPLVEEKEEEKEKIVDDVPQRPERTNEEKARREQGYTSNIQIFVPGVDDVKEENNVNPSEVKKATENVDLKESVEFFNDVIDDMSSKKSASTEESEEDFRD